MKLIILAACAVALSSCENLKNFSLTTPYGTVITDSKGNVSGNVVIPAKSGK